MNKVKLKSCLKTFYGITVVILLWYILHKAVNSAVVPSPLATFKYFFKVLPKTLTPHIVASLLRIFIALFLSVIIGVPIGLITGLSKKVDGVMAPILYILYPIPKIAFLPVLMIFFGLGNTPKIILMFIIIVFQIIMAVRDGVQEIPKELILSIKSLGVSKLETYKHLIFPATLPKIFTAVRISVGISIAVLFTSENFATTYGIGYFIMNSWSMINYLEMFSGIVALSIMGFILFKIIDVLENKFCHWVRIGKD
ncbi:ABC transporter permease [Clostridium sp. MSJ-4]|uniref:ABC transporter permease n=1 Tax=Clostridium simiarum TaxID=2841506 RepID=A0ABS6F4J5_9CLOT|nr:ABC transporter permease [Clostridium simiarum]